MKRPFLLLFGVLLLAGCDSQDAQEDDIPTDAGRIVIGDYTLDGMQGDPFELRAARIDGMLLVLDVAYSGGCEEHEFAGFAPEVVLAIYPPQLSVFVVHDSHSDMCEAYISESVSLDLTPLAATFGEIFQVTVLPVHSDSESIVLQRGQ